MPTYNLEQCHRDGTGDHGREVTHSYLKLLVHVNENMGCVCCDIVCSMFVHMEGEGGHIYFV